MPPVFSCMFPSWEAIVPRKIVLTGIVTLASGVQLIYFARRVYKAREKHSIQYPAVTGHPEFERTYRAQQIMLEWNPIFMGTLWTTTLFLHQVPAAICGLLYLISRHRYFNGYSRGVEERLPGFLMGARILLVMKVMSAVGIGLTVVRIFLNHHSWHRSSEGMTLPWRGGEGGEEAFIRQGGFGGHPGGHPGGYPHAPHAHGWHH